MVFWDAAWRRTGLEGGNVFALGRMLVPAPGLSRQATPAARKI